MNILGKRVKERREALGLSQPALAKRVGMTQQGINSIEQGDSLRPRKLKELALALKTTQEYLLGEVDNPENSRYPHERGDRKVRTIPVVSYVQAGSMSEIADPYPAGTGHAEVTVYKAEDIGPRAFALEVEGESMIVNPPVMGAVSYLPGEIIVCDPDAPLKPGDLVIAKTEAGATFKKYRPGGSNKNGAEIIYLVPLNDDWESIKIDQSNPGTIVGKIVRHTRTP